MSRNRLTRNPQVPTFATDLYLFIYEVTSFIFFTTGRTTSTSACWGTQFDKPSRDHTGVIHHDLDLTAIAGA
jgi:hypothetical protein